MNLGSHIQGPGHREVHLFDQVGYGDKAFMDGNVGPFGVFDIPLVGIGITAKNKLQALPFQAVADRSIQDVVGWPGANSDTIFLVYNLVLAPVVELMNLQYLARRRQSSCPSDNIPG